RTARLARVLRGWAFREGGRLVGHERHAAPAVEQLDALALVRGRAARVGEGAHRAVVHPDGDGPIRFLVAVLLDLVARVGARTRAGDRRDRVAAAAADLV